MSACKLRGISLLFLRSVPAIVIFCSNRFSAVVKDVMSLVVVTFCPVL